MFTIEIRSGLDMWEEFVLGLVLFHLLLSGLWASQRHQIGPCEKQDTGLDGPLA